MRDHRRYSSEWTRGGGYTNDAVKFCMGGVGGVEAVGEDERLFQKDGEFGFINLKKNVDYNCVDDKNKV